MLMDENFDYKILKPILENHLKELQMDDVADDEGNDDDLDGLQFIDNGFNFFLRMIFPKKYRDYLSKLSWLRMRTVKWYMLEKKHQKMMKLNGLVLDNQ